MTIAAPGLTECKDQWRVKTQDDHVAKNEDSSDLVTDAWSLNLHILSDAPDKRACAKISLVIELSC